MFASKFQSLFLTFAKPANLLRLGLVVFLLTTLYFRLPVSVNEVAHPVAVGAVTCTSGCEAAGHCWPQGFEGTDGPTGCKAVCSGTSWSNVNCNSATQAEREAAAHNYNQYQSNVAAAGGQPAAYTQGTGVNGGPAIAVTDIRTGAVTTAAAVAANTSCGPGSASGCSGKAFYSEPAPGYLCFPNGVNVTTGQPVCGRDTKGNVAVVTNPLTGKAEGGYIMSAEVGNTNYGPRNTNPDGGGCYGVAVCGCSTGQVSLCLNENATKSIGSVAEYCARNVCTPIGTVNASGQTKVCTPGQVSECLPGTTQGRYCNTSGTGWTTVHAHACGATHTVAYCANSGGNSVTGTQCNGLTFGTEAECKNTLGAASCKQGVAKISQSSDIASASCANNCDSAACKNACIQTVENRLSCLQTAAGIANPNTCNAVVAGGLPVGAANAVNNIIQSVQTGKCTAAGTYSTFVGCGTGSQSKWNCYKSCVNGAESTTCRNEPGLSCGAHESNVISQQIAAVETRFVQSNPPTTPTSPPPSTPPAPTPTPTVTCGQPCGGSNGAYCTGANMACTAGVCKSTLCAPAEQNNQCICASPPPNPPICVDIFASKTNIKIGDQVSFTCAAVANATSYQFRWGYVKKQEGVEGIQMQELASTSTTSRTSQPITVDKVGRYIAQCRPCAANNLCSEWEPVGGENSAPELEPGASTTDATSTTNACVNTLAVDFASTQVSSYDNRFSYVMPAGTTYNSENGTLNIAFPNPSSVGGPAWVNGKKALVGNFQAQVDVTAVSVGSPSAKTNNALIITANPTTGKEEILVRRASNEEVTGATIDLVLRKGGADTVLGATAIGLTEPLQLRAVREGDKVKGYYKKPSDSAWTLLGEHPFPTTDATASFFLNQVGTSTGQGPTGSFDNFETSCVGAQ